MELLAPGEELWYLLELRAWKHLRRRTILNVRNRVARDVLRDVLFGIHVRIRDQVREQVREQALEEGHG